ncbi:hypothetical protein TNCV_2355631 [Trichonephila clavipes]|nr:hypothetical protein TNCV_2355631 [Trichonephila clavipes]
MSNISKYSLASLSNFACYNGNHRNQAESEGLAQTRLSYGPRGRSVGRRGQVSMPANLPEHPAQLIALDMLYPMHFAHLR